MCLDRLEDKKLKSFYESKDKKNIIYSMGEDDKDKLRELDTWAYKAFEYTIIERTVHKKPRRGEIWTVDLGINVGTEIDKIRPCIVVSYDKFNDNSNLITLIPITHSDFSHKTQFRICEDVLIYSEKGLSGTAKAEQITTKSKARLGRKIGELNDKGMILTIKALLNHLGLDFISAMIDNLPKDEMYKLIDTTFDVYMDSTKITNEEEYLDCEHSLYIEEDIQEAVQENIEVDNISNEYVTDIDNDCVTTSESFNNSNEKKDINKAKYNEKLRKRQLSTNGKGKKKKKR